MAASVAYFAILALPFVVVIVASSLSTTAIVWLYAFGVLADLAAAVVWIAAALRYRTRALRGELFSIPFVTPLADRLARSEG